MALFSIVRFDGLKSRDWLIFKFPSEDLVLGSQLIVQEGQVAIFVKGGTVADVFYSGTYTLSTGNLPLLKGLVNLPFGGETPFSAEVYFLNTTVRLDVNWGTIDPIQLIDPKYYVKLRVRAFGQMGLRVCNCDVLFKQVIGGMQKADIIKFDKVKEYYRGLLVIKVKSAIADAIITNGISALEIAAKLESLSDEVKEQISPEFEKYGFEVANFYIQSINFPDEDFEKINKILEDKAAFEIMGDSRYSTKRSFDVYEGAATNDSGVAGAFAGGIGLGAALNMSTSMNQAIGNPIQKIETQECIECHAKIQTGSKFCPECGASNTMKTCECGSLLNLGIKFCPECGRRWSNMNKKSLILGFSSVIVALYVVIVLYVFFVFFNINTIANFTVAIIFEIISFLILVGLIYRNVLVKPIKTGYFIPLILITITYLVIVNIVNILIIVKIPMIFFVFVHLVLLTIYCLVSMPMYIMGRK